ncbi:DUF6308 family protein [Streptomyces sp. NPDC057301]|uniref:DUF6308 family protein n=1 Tax=Streptomyces sp. NPDC057301 TaxID=3346093 RepID=UPI003632EFF3
MQAAEKPSLNIDRVDVEAAGLAKWSPAHTAWRLLCDQPGMGWVTAGKLLARKRPRLLPVYDQVVRCILGRSKSFWFDLHGALRAYNHALHSELTALRHAADLPETVSALRVCDVGALDAAPCGPSTEKLHRGQRSLGRT